MSVTCLSVFLQGNICAVPCLVGMFGQNCTSVCTCQNGGVCNHVDGSCTCPPGYTGTRYFFFSVLRSKGSKRRELKRKRGKMIAGHLKRLERFFQSWKGRGRITSKHWHTCTQIHALLFLSFVSMFSLWTWNQCRKTSEKINQYAVGLCVQPPKHWLFYWKPYERLPHAGAIAFPTLALSDQAYISPCLGDRFTGIRVIVSIRV